jgi:hypothetical protein
LRHDGKKGGDLVALELLSQNGLAMFINTVHLKYIFRQVDTNGHNFHTGRSSWFVVSEALPLWHVETSGLWMGRPYQ